MHSLTTVVHYARDAVTTAKTLAARVSYYFHPKLGQHIVKFPDYVKAAVVRISPTPPPGGIAWESLSATQQREMSRADIFAATEELIHKNGGQLPPGIVKVQDEYGKLTGQLSVNGETHTWHHTHKKGVMELIPTELHQSSMRHQLGPNDPLVGPHIGHALWWTDLFS